MTATLQKIADDLMKLPPTERIELAEALILNTPEFVDGGVEAAWDEELRRRIDDVDAGREKLIPSEESFASARKSLDEARRASLSRSP